MIYPKNYESKIGFDEICRLLKGHCLSTLGKEKVDEMTFSDDAAEVNEWLNQIREFRRLMQATEQMPMNYFFDVRESVARIRLENTHLEEDELFDLRRSLETIGVIVNFLNKNNGDDEFPEYTYPSLRSLAKDVQTFPALIRRIDSILDKFGKDVTTYAYDMENQGLCHHDPSGNPPRHRANGRFHLSHTLYHSTRCPTRRSGGQGHSPHPTRRTTDDSRSTRTEAQDKGYRTRRIGNGKDGVHRTG